MSLLDRIKIWLTSVNPFLSKFCTNGTLHSCWFDRGRHCGRMVRDTASLLILPLLPQNGGPKFIPGPTSRRVLAPEHMLEDIDKAAACCAECHYELSDVAFCQISLVLVVIIYKWTLLSDIVTRGQELCCSWKWHFISSTTALLSTKWFNFRSTFVHCVGLHCTCLTLPICHYVCQWLTDLGLLLMFIQW